MFKVFKEERNKEFQQRTGTYKSRRSAKKNEKWKIWNEDHDRFNSDLDPVLGTGRKIH